MDPVTYLLGLVPARYWPCVFIPTAVCAIVDAVVPQPPPGSRWVPIRRLVSLVGGAFGWARNAVPAGSREVLIARKNNS
ncbi:MAG: hypothetical protein ACRYHQ_31935 [Janthinobacterium lividum]